MMLLFMQPLGDDSEGDSSSDDEEREVNADTNDANIENFGSLCIVDKVI